MNFQRQLAIAPTSLHTIAFIVMVAWLVTGLFGNTPNPFDFGHTPIVSTGWWSLLPSMFRHIAWINSLIGLIITLIVCYTIAELNASNVLLRVNSRIMSITFGALICVCPFLHTFNPGMILLMCILLSYFSLFSSYQLENTASLIYVTFLYLSIASLVFLKILWLAPVYWLSMYILRSGNIRSILASILGLATPYWIVGTAAYCYGKLPAFWHTMSQLYIFHWGNHSLLSSGAWATITLVFIMFMIGVIDFYSRIYMDKNRTRNLYYVIILHGFAYFLLLVLQPVNVQALMPLTLLSSSIMAGHYIANGETSMSNIITIIISVGLVILWTLNTWIL